MKQQTRHEAQPWLCSAVADAADHDLQTLLDEPFARAWQHEGPCGAAERTRGRLAARLGASKQAESVMLTVRRRGGARQLLAPGVEVQTLYRAQDGLPLRPGEPLRVRLLEMAPASTLETAAFEAGLQAPECRREWLLLAGDLRLGGQSLAPCDYHCGPAGCTRLPLSSQAGALLFLRESAAGPAPGERAVTVHDAEAGWPAFGPGIQRRLLWQRDGHAAFLYRAQPGAQVPVHSHGHDEECLLLQGELFLDDVLLLAGDYQLARAGSSHRITTTERGAVIYAHGDLSLQLGA